MAHGAACCSSHGSWIPSPHVVGEPYPGGRAAAARGVLLINAHQVFEVLVGHIPETTMSQTLVRNHTTGSQAGKSA